MVIETTPEEADLFNEISLNANRLWEKSRQVEGLSNDPKMFSVMLFKRLCSNHSGYALLWENEFPLEADIILRAGIEAAICIAANEAMREAFVGLLRRDACATLQGQINMHRHVGDSDAAQKAEAILSSMRSNRPDDDKPARLNWRELADAGGVSHLYGWHRKLSGMSSHVTGASVLRAIEFTDGPTPGGNVPAVERKLHLMKMAGATLEGSRRHAAMLGDEKEVESAIELLKRLAELSKLWSEAARMG